MNFFTRLFPGLKHYALSYRLLVYVVLCSSLFALLATAIQLYLDYRRDVATLNESFRFIEKSYLHTIAASTFKIDTDHLRLELEGALKLPDIVYLEVQELRGDQIHTHAHGDPNATKIIRREFPLEYISPSGDKWAMGTLIAIASLEGVYERLWSRVLTVLVTNMVKTFLASTCILAIIYFLITRHLMRMASYTQRMAPGTPNRLLTLNRRSPKTDKPDELEQVAMAINDLQERAAADIIKLRDAYTEIEQLKNQLEAETAYLQEEIKLEYDFESIIGNSPSLQHALFKVEQVADTDTSVLVLGETGTGKELISRAIHNSSSRGQHPLVKVNCAALPQNLIESELFGHEPGAFTGARNRQIGRFEVANDSSIFLDEIGDLPLELQTRLLQVLQDGEFERLDSSRTIKVDVRVIAATNRDMEAQVRKGEFREDLFFRLNVFPITVPPLRERIEDIPLLVEYFLEKAATRLGKSVKTVPTGVMKTLKNYP